jgi:hypothetical protein
VYATITTEELRDDDLHDEPAAASPNWAKARCSDGNGTLTHLFFSEDLIDIARAKAICSKCSLAAPCLSGALERAEPFGVWGGQLLANGAIVTHKRRRGRPPKHPRPEPVVDEVILPPYIQVKTA